MSHRPEDHYAYVATRDLHVHGVKAFSAGDPVPDDTVNRHGFDADGSAVRRDQWADRPTDEPQRPLTRGEMPRDLRGLPGSAPAPEPAQPPAEPVRKPAAKAKSEG